MQLKSSIAVLVFALSVIVALVPHLTVQSVRSSMIIVPDDYPTIQAAINAAAVGDVVFVRSGIYYEHITISKSITLVGENNDAAVIDGNGTGISTGFLSARAIVVLKANGIRIMNLTVRNAGLNYALGQWDGCIVCLPGGRDIDVENNIVQNAGRGIVFGNGASSIFINNNTISGIVDYAIDIGGWTSPTATNVTISNNVIHDARGSGINLDGNTSNCTILNNTVTDSCIGIDLGSNVNTYIVPTGNLIDGNILSNNSVTNLYVIGSPHSWQANYTNIFRRNNLTNLLHSNLIVWGWNTPAVFMQDIDASNTANGKRIYYVTNSRDLEIDPSDCPDAGYVALVNCANVTVKDFDFSGNKDGLLLAGTNNCTLANVSLGSNRLYVTSMNVTVLSHWGGLVLFESDNNTIEDCTIRDSSNGVCLYQSDWNLFLHDSFTGNDRDVASDYYYPYGNYSSGYLSSNFWDSGYSSGGNYWKDYNGTDSNGDGIGDTPYIIDANNTDHYPLMSPYWYWSNPASYDLNRDMKIDMKDVGSAAACFGSRAGDSKWNPRADVVGDGEVDIRDLVAIARHFGEH